MTINKIDSRFVENASNGKTIRQEIDGVNGELVEIETDLSNIDGRVSQAENNLEDRGINVTEHGVVADEVTDQTTSIQTIVDALTLPNTIFIPFGVVWNYNNFTHPNELTIYDHSRYDAKNSAWTAQLRTYIKTSNPEIKNANENVLLSPYHPANVVDNVGGTNATEKRASTVYRLNGVSKWRHGMGANTDDTHYIISKFPNAETMFSIEYDTSEYAFGSLPVKGVSYYFVNKVTTSKHVRRYKSHTGSGGFEHQYMIDNALVKREQIDEQGNSKVLNGSGAETYSVDIDGTYSGTKKKVIPRTTTSNVLDRDSESIFSNEGATGGFVLNLPSAKKGLKYTFYNVTGTNLRILRQTGDSFRGMTGNIETLAQGNNVTVECVINGIWEIPINNGFVNI
ncbi:hypothetical protein [Aquibacillus kalidii]|uniref:hypothetical protein n=1 Tax=Aquibacillus kalidii TaxID=2762597 RepID=UPI001647EF84|nr:hypothetical protein [Aquibacillus kalidii]